MDGTLINAGIAIAVLGGGGYGVVYLVRHLSKQAEGAGARQVEKLLSKGDRLGAAKKAQEHGLFARAAQIYQLANRPADAARAFRKGAEWGEAAKIFEQIKDWDSAAFCYRKLGDDGARLHVFKKAGMWAEAAKLAIKMGRSLEAADILVQAGDRERAAEQYRLGGEQTKATTITAELLEERGELASAGRTWAQLENWERAFDCFKRGGDDQMAAKVLIKVGRREEAAELYAQSGRTEEAAQMFEHLQLYRRAATLYSKAGNHARALHCLTLEGDHLAVVKLRVARGEISEAIALAESLDATSAAFLQAIELAADLRHQADDPAGALKNLYRLIQAPLPSEKRRSITKRATELCLELRQPRLGRLLLDRLDGTLGDAPGENTWANAIRGQFLEMNEEDSNELGILTTAAPRASGGMVQVGDARRSNEASGLIEGTVAYVDGSVIAGAGTETFGVEVGPDGWPDGVPPALARRYSGLERLGQGGNGVVFRATDIMLDRTVVLKFMIEGSMPTEMARKYFQREIRMAASLSHPNIVHIYDMGNEDGIPWYSMEYVEGLPLTAHLPLGRPLGDRIFLMSMVEQLCAALDHAHGKDMVHRDIKPGNVLVATDGTCKLLDFGLARAMDEGFGENSVLAGTPYYMAPEQIDGSEVDHRADIYALGVIIYRMFTGHLPFTEGNIFVAHALEPVPDPLGFNPDIPAKVVQVILRCLEKSPAARYNNCMKISRDLNDALFADVRADSGAA